MLKLLLAAALCTAMACRSASAQHVDRREYAGNTCTSKLCVSMKVTTALPFAGATYSLVAFDLWATFKTPMHIYRSGPNVEFMDRFDVEPFLFTSCSGFAGESCFHRRYFDGPQALDFVPTDGFVYFALPYPETPDQLPNYGPQNPFYPNLPGGNPPLGSVSFRLSEVPEPTTYAMMLAGLAMVGGVAARRRKWARV